MTSGRKVAAGAAGAVALGLLGFGLSAAVKQPAAADSSVEAQAPLNLVVVSQTSSKLTVAWTPYLAGLGYELTVDGKRVANSWNSALAKTTFAKPDAAQHVYGVVAVCTGLSLHGRSAGHGDRPRPEQRRRVVGERVRRRVGVMQPVRHRDHLQPFDILLDVPGGV